MTERVIERAFPWILAGIAGCATWWILPDSTIAKIVQKLNGPVIEISAIAFGFVMTVTTLLITLDGKTAIRTLRDIGAYKILLGYLKVSMYSWIWVCGSTALLALVETDTLDIRACVAGWVALLTLAILATYRVATALFALLSLPDDSRQKTGDTPRPRFAASK